MFFWVTLFAFVYGSAMCWISEVRKPVWVTWIAWFAVASLKVPLHLPYYSLIITQGVFGTYLLLRWRFEVR